MTVFQEIHTFTIECPNPECSDPTAIRRNGTDGDTQLYRCDSCGKGFSADGSAMHKQYTAHQIGVALDLYFSGLSYQQIAEHMGKFQGVPEPSKRSVHDWVKAYSSMAKKFMDGKVGEDGREASASGEPIRAKVGNAWAADEMFLRVGGQQMYLWNVMDTKSRYILYAHLSADRTKADAIKVMEGALAAAEKPPATITTDGLESYKEAVETVFPKSTEHIVSQSIRHEINNNLSERLQGTLRSRTKTQRGLESLETGQDYIDGYVLDYNFFKRHEALNGRVPAEAAGVSGQVPWSDSWEGVAKMGGEAAEPQNLTVEPIMRKAEPKPDDEEVRSAVEEYLAAERRRKEVATAKKKYRARDKSPVAGQPVRHRRSQPSRGRGVLR